MHELAMNVGMGMGIVIAIGIFLLLVFTIMSFFTGLAVKSVNQIVDFYFDRKEKFFSSSVAAAGDEVRRGLGSDKSLISEFPSKKPLS